MRTLHNDFKAVLDDQVIVPRFLFETEVVGTTVEGVYEPHFLRYWTGEFTLTWDSKTWLGGVTLRNIEGYSENEGLDSGGISISLPGEPTALISTILQDLRQNLPGKAWLMFLDASTGAIVANPHQFFYGRLSQAELSDAADQAALKLSFESAFSDLGKAKEFRYSHQCQQQFYPGDNGFIYLEQMEQWTGYWGKHKRKPRKESGKNKKRGTK